MVPTWRYGLGGDAVWEAVLLSLTYITRPPSPSTPPTPYFLLQQPYLILFRSSTSIIFVFNVLQGKILFFFVIHEGVSQLGMYGKDWTKEYVFDNNVQSNISERIIGVENERIEVRNKTKMTFRRCYFVEVAEKASKKNLED